jgi:hypothetical protein
MVIQQNASWMPRATSHNLHIDRVSERPLCEWCETRPDVPRQCETLQDGARCCEMAQEQECSKKKSETETEAENSLDVVIQRVWETEPDANLYHIISPLACSHVKERRKYIPCTRAGASQFVRDPAPVACAAAAASRRHCRCCWRRRTSLVSGFAIEDPRSPRLFDPVPNTCLYVAVSDC